jgi:HAD superfamily hydrolase (TIGR01509 family)
MTIRAVVFDVGGVFERVQDDTWPVTWLSRWERLMDLPAGHAMASLAAHGPAGDVVTGEVSEAGLRAAYAAALGLDDARADLMMAEMWDEYCGELDVQMRDFAAGLRPRHATAILSNSADGARREEQRRYGFEQLVDVIVYSHEVGLAKPDPGIFRLTERRLGVQAHEVVFFDDHEGHVDAARACGWHAVWHRDTAESIARVRALLGGE